MKFIFCIAFLFISAQNFAQCNFYGSIKDADNANEIPFAKVVFSPMDSGSAIITVADIFGRFHLENIQFGYYTIEITSTGYNPTAININLDQPEYNENFQMIRNTNLPSVEIVYDAPFESNRMSIIDGATLTHSKKTQLVDIDKIPANTATNNARELYATVPGLNIWESDGGGLQLGIGARGLSPNRTEHFNTRQNGYDISADALGYPESYYTPPSEAIQSVQFIRGAASLQFGPQFGGMVNFKLRPASQKAFEYRGSHTYGAYNLVNTFNSFSGTIKNRFSYLAYYNYKRGDGWRDNSAFDQHNAFAQLKYYFNENMFLSVEYTYMNYLAQQAGGLTDAMFQANPKQSIRNRNWFNVDWRILAANYNWKITNRSMLDLKFFKIDASRLALGNLDKISRLDDYLERDLIAGKFDNFGLELRLLQHYPIGKKMKGVITYGARYYQGQTSNQQGLADSTSKANFSFLHPDELEGSDYIFPSRNIAGYFENMLQLSEKFWISAGFRYEFIDTKAEGTYREMVYHPLTNELIFDSTYTESKSNQRSIYLGGIGFTWRISKDAEIYGNIAQNYRGINFSDIRVINPNMQIDPNMKDEKGFNADLGIRAVKKSLTYDVSAFFLYYDNKIGLIDKKLSDYEYVRYRTNVGKAYSTGIELFVEHKFKLNPKKSAENYFSIFGNFAFVYARYGNFDNNAYSGNWVELVPPVTAKIGLRYQTQKWRFSYLATYVHKQYSDATNATSDPDAIAGLIPSYYVMDASVAYELNKKITFKSGVNNLTNNKYFTRRATGYPGPGIIPSDGISFYVTVALVL
ncbi:MAG: TonB-dependent receptor [Crocinitomicaceae bacterium]|nr:TonB-dependent receptor [Crocinitomicaceae bacterium]